MLGHAQAESVAVLPGASGIEANLRADYFSAAVSSVVLGLLGGFLISRVLEPRLGTYQERDEAEAVTISPERWRGLRVTGVVVAGHVVPLSGTIGCPGTGCAEILGPDGRG